MSRKVLTAEIVSKDNSRLDEFCRVWISKDLANELQIVPKKDWLYMSKDWMGILSTQALVEDVVNEVGYKVLASPDRIKEAHFKNGDKAKVWKLTEWE